MVEGLFNKNSTYEPAEKLIKDGLKKLINEFNYQNRKFNI